MSPTRVRFVDQTTKHNFLETNLHILGIGIEYPQYICTPRDLRRFAFRHYPKTPALQKILSINENTGIDVRSVACPMDHPLLNKPEAPSIEELSGFFLTEGVKLAVWACRKAIGEWGGDVSEITHMVATTCTNSANPGYDYHVARELGLSGRVERTLLHGVGCAGGLSVLRTAANLALTATYMGAPARILVVTCELASMMVRSELDLLTRDQELRVGVTLFSDGAAALVLSNGIGDTWNERPIYDLLAWDYHTLPETEKDIGFDVHSHGWKVNLTPRVPALAATAVPPLFNSLLPRVPSLNCGSAAPEPQDFDWALHPGGAKVITGVQKLLSLTPHHLRASYDIYKNHGNSSSAAVLSVLNRLREMDEGRDNVVACAFGPGVAVEMCIFRRHRQSSPRSMYSLNAEIKRQFC
ncbi:hypothetical protein NM688_g638 [Phlebia brevispora]|uniref:Uncharacterized protein n=1 Tax=Phlebia brevispora TaxID=194682 RepID=A0ACC1TE54_9APHY|nr:hypothetical protein NM688_g638 [Phlebia brevispora]